MIPPPPRQLFIITAVVAVLASGAALWFQRDHFDPVDRVMLPGIVGLWLVLVPAVQYRKVRFRTVQFTLFAAYAVYFLLALNQQFRGIILQYHMLAPSTYWFAALYVAAFLYFLPGVALRLSAAIYSLSLLIIVGNIALAPALLRDGTLMASVLQFGLVGLTVLLLQFVMGQRHEAMIATQLAAYQDALTGCANRRAGEERLLALERSQVPFTLVLFDLDHFKRINDQHGHAAGDSVLRAVVHEAQKTVPPGTLCVRWGGEEFLLILPALPSPEVMRGLQNFAERLENIRVGTVTGVTASFGVAERTPAESSAELLLRADQAMYAAKALGRNRIEYSQPGQVRGADSLHLFQGQLEQKSPPS